MDFIFCRGGDKTAPEIAKRAGMKYGIRWDYTAYGNVYMLDAGLKTRWITYKRKARKLRPTFALVPDFEAYRDLSTIELYVMDLRALNIPLIGIAPKFYGALEQLPNDPDIVISISIPTEYSGYLPKDEEIRPGAKYHLLGGEIRAQIAEAKRIKKLGGNVISADGSYLYLKAANGQIYSGGKWIIVNDTTYNNALTSARNINAEIQSL